ncbi:hypothetical protein QTP88_024641 [Uroleucon formosanum]
MSPEVKRRVRALKRLILAQNEIKLRFKTEIHLLKLKYQKVYESYINKQTEIIQGNYELTNSEYNCSEEEDEQVPRYDELGEVGLEPCKQEPKGTLDFWLVYMEDSCYLSEEYIGFTTDFHFIPNEWFTNNILTLKFEEDPSDNIYDIVKLYGIEDAIEYKLTDCEINWNEGKNVTQEIKNETLEGTEVPFNKTVENPSFFNLFNDTFNFTNPNRRRLQQQDPKAARFAAWLTQCLLVGGGGVDVRPRLSREYYRSTLKKADGLSLIVTSDLSIYILFEIVYVYVCVCSFAFGLSGGMVVGECAWVVGESLGQIRTKDVTPLLRQAEKKCYRVNGEDYKAILWLPPLPH